MNPIYLTKNESEKLEKELHHLKYVERPKVIQSIADAREQGDLSENAEYSAAKEKQVLLERKIQQLEFMQARIRIIEPKEGVSSTIRVGSKVTLLNLNKGITMTGLVASTAELNFYDMEVISLESAVGKNIIGKSVGDVIEIDIQTGKLKYEILEVA
ncbi:MAG TPA: transcription elongation factor GreA [bacterium]